MYLPTQTTSNIDQEVMLSIQNYMQNLMVNRDMSLSSDDGDDHERKFAQINNEMIHISDHDDSDDQTDHNHRRQQSTDDNQDLRQIIKCLKQ